MRNLLAAALALVLSTLSLSAEPLPLDLFLKAPEFRTPKLSPDGRFYALVRTHEDLEYLSIVDLATAQTRPVVTFANLKLVNYWWKSSGAILFLVEDNTGQQDFRSFDLETKKTNSLRRFNAQGGFFVNPLLDDEKNILVSTIDGSGYDLKKMDVGSGKVKTLQANVGYIQRWLTDRKGQIVAGFGRLQNDSWFMTFPTDSGKSWRQILLGNKGLPDFWPLNVAPDQHRILGLDYLAGDTTKAVLWNPLDDTKEVLEESAEVDMDYDLIWGDDFTHPRAIAFQTDRPGFHYLDPADLALAKSIDGALPGTVNIIVSASADESRLIIMSYSDTLPDRYLLLDRKAGRIALLGSAHSQINPEQMATSKYFTFTARDGLKLHGRITLPKELKAPHRTVLLAGTSLDGERTSFVFQPYMQLVASRGYATVEIDQRGTKGYGLKFAEAGNLQISGAMTDDLADGLRYLIQEGLVDQDRIAILGQYKGGIIALHTLARYPEMFKVWINFSTPMKPDYWGFEDVTFGRYTPEELPVRMGGNKAGKAYISSLDPMPLLSKVRVPSFHYYPTLTNESRLAYHGDRAEKYFGKAGLPYSFIKGSEIPRLSDIHGTLGQLQRKETERVYTELITFLNQHLAARN
ncbi:MAG: prolyl oligopeptidase family serine peptidase [bacterium]|nr:prolyl oligopeptidase family serine peptidase [bacterium]MDI1336033.1 prolyl oligopeptidase family serine peptidase [Lacunisphaera sp.]